MKKFFTPLLLTLTALVGGGVVAGSYFAKEAIVSKGETVDNDVLDPFVSSLYGEEAKGSVTYTIASEDKKGYVQQAFAVKFTDDTYGFAFELINKGAEFDTMRFAIGVKENTVNAYKYLKLVDGHSVGEEQVYNMPMFVGYTLGGADVNCGVTVMDTYNTMKKAVDFALTEIQSVNPEEVYKSASTEGPVGIDSVAKNVLPDQAILAEEEFTDYEDTKRIKAGYKLTLGDESKAFYYKLYNLGAEYDTMYFEIAIKDGTVVGYHYLSLEDGHSVGEEQVYNKPMFVGYTLGGADVDCGVTVMDTYNTMKKAVDAALTDCQGR